MANGFPIAAVTGSADLMGMFAPAGGSVFFGGTYNGHPAMAAAAVATIDSLEDDAHRHLHQLGARVVAGLEGAASAAGLKVQVHGHGSVFAVYFGDSSVVSARTAQQTDLER